VPFGAGLNVWSDPVLCVVGGAVEEDKRPWNGEQPATAAVAVTAPATRKIRRRNDLIMGRVPPWGLLDGHGSVTTLTVSADSSTFAQLRGLATAGVSWRRPYREVFSSLDGISIKGVLTNSVRPHWR
jgi:hypothetical protein